MIEDEIVHDTSDQRIITGDVAALEDLIEVVKWMYERGQPVFGKDERIERIIERSSRSLGWGRGR